jgi:hypothetical protein
LIGIGATGLGKAAEPDLFEPAHRGRRRRLTAAVDQVRERFGFDALAEARLLALKRRS